jgi:hypothetical protein
MFAVDHAPTRITARAMFVVDVSAVSPDGSLTETNIPFQLIEYHASTRDFKFYPQSVPAGKPLRQLLRGGGA